MRMSTVMLNIEKLCRLRVLTRGESKHGLIVAIESKSIASVADSEDAREEAAVVHMSSQRNIRGTGRDPGTRQEQQKASFFDRGGDSEDRETRLHFHTLYADKLSETLKWNNSTRENEANHSHWQA